MKILIAQFQIAERTYHVGKIQGSYWLSEYTAQGDKLSKNELLHDFPEQPKRSHGEFDDIDAIFQMLKFIQNRHALLKLEAGEMPS